MNDEIKALIMPTIEKMSEQSGDDEETIFAEVETAFNGYVKHGMDEMNAAKTAVNSVKTSYRQLIRLGAEMFEGFFIGSTASQDSNIFDRNRANTLLESFIDELGCSKDDIHVWKPKAFEAGFIDVSGNLIYSKQFIDEFKNGNSKLGWMIGKKIEEKFRKTAYCFAKKFNSDDDYEMFTCYVNDPDNFLPSFDMIYKFRAVKKSSSSGEFLELYKNVSTLHKLGSIDFDTIEEYIGSLGENIRTIESVYDYNSGIAEMPISPLPKFWITDAVVGSLETTGYGSTKIAVIDQLGDFDSEEVEMELPTDNATGLYEGAIGILVYRPFFRRKEIDGESRLIPSGNAFSFLINTKFAPVFEGEITEEYQEEY